MAILLSACGQKGPLYLPDAGGEVVTRPTQTVPGAPAPSTEETAPQDGEQAATPQPPR